MKASNPVISTVTPSLRREKVGQVTPLLEYGGFPVALSRHAVLALVAQPLPRAKMPTLSRCGLSAHLRHFFVRTDKKESFNYCEKSSFPYSIFPLNIPFRVGKLGSFCSGNLPNSANTSKEFLSINGA